MEEAERVSGLLQQTVMNPGFIGLVSYLQHKNNMNGFIGHMGQIQEIITIHKVDEVIFCAKDIPAHLIIDKMSELKDQEVDFKIAPPESLSIIGSNSINTSGDLYVIDINTITKLSNRRNKRMFDLLLSLSLLFLYPLVIWIMKKPIGLMLNIFSVILGYRSWVGYSLRTESDVHLPGIRKGVLNPEDALKNKEIPREINQQLNLMYARDYKLTNDFNIIIRGFRDMGRR